MCLCWKRLANVINYFFVFTFTPFRRNFFCSLRKNSVCYKQRKLHCDQISVIYLRSWKLTRCSKFTIISSSQKTNLPYILEMDPKFIFIADFVAFISSEASVLHSCLRMYVQVLFTNGQYTVNKKTQKIIMHRVFFTYLLTLKNLLLALKHTASLLPQIHILLSNKLQ